MSLKQFAAFIGFAFVAVWIGFDFGDAVLCLVGAAVFYAGAGVALGEVDLAGVQDRLQRSDSGPQQSYRSTPSQRVR